MAKLLEMKDISKSFFGVEVLHDVNFDLERGEVIALCGENGAGKSTLMKILAAVYTHDTGEIFLDGQQVPAHADTLMMQHLGVSMIHQELNLMEYLTVAQNIFLTREPLKKNGLIDYKKMNTEAKKLLDELGQDIDPREKICNLKIAQKQMVEIAKAMSFNVKVMIMDEPTSMLTSKETDILFGLIHKLSAEGMGIVYISHRLKEVKIVCEKVTVLRDGEFIATKNVSDVTEQDIANLMVGREVKASVVEDFKGDRSDVVFELRHVTDELLKDVSIQVARGEIVGFSGLVGAGRSELMEYAFGLRRVEKGEVLINGKPVTIKTPVDAIRQGVGFATEDRQRTGMFQGLSLEDNINLISQLKYKGFINHKKDRQENADKMIDEINIKCTGKDQLVSSLSGGNQQKVVLAKWLLVESDILILDEPTRGIDVGAREEIYNIIKELAAKGKTIIIVSSDLTEILSICQRIFVMHEGELKAELTQSDRTEEKVMKYATNAS